MAGGGFTIGDWCWFTRQASPCRVIERQDVWGEIAYRVWLPAKDAVVRARASDLASLESVRPSVEQLLHTTAAARMPMPAPTNARMRSRASMRTGAGQNAASQLLVSMDGNCGIETVDTLSIHPRHRSP